MFVSIVLNISESVEKEKDNKNSMHENQADIYYKERLVKRHYLFYNYR